MKRIAIAALLLASSQSVLAAESSLAGFYAGANLGAAQGTFTSTEYNGVWDYGEYSATTGLGATYGIQTGYNFKVGNSALMGVELGYSMPQIDESVPFSTTYKNSADWKSEIALRLKGGVVVDQVWMYAIAGFAQTKVDFFFGDTSTTNHQSGSVSDLGLTYGVGLAMPVANHLAVRAEFLNSDAKSKTYSNFGTSGGPGSFHADTQSFVIGLNYNFGF